MPLSTELSLAPFWLFSFLVVVCGALFTVMFIVGVRYLRDREAVLAAETQEFIRRAADSVQVREVESARLAKMALEIVGAQQGRLVDKFPGLPARQPVASAPTGQKIAGDITDQIAKATSTLFPDSPSMDRPFAIHTFDTVPQEVPLNGATNRQWHGSND